MHCDADLSFRSSPRMKEGHTYQYMLRDRPRFWKFQVAVRALVWMETGARASFAVESCCSCIGGARIMGRRTMLLNGRHRWDWTQMTRGWSWSRRWLNRNVCGVILPLFWTQWWRDVLRRDLLLCSTGTTSTGRRPFFENTSLIRHLLGTTSQWETLWPRKLSNLLDPIAENNKLQSI